MAESDETVAELISSSVLSFYCIYAGANEPEVFTVVPTGSQLLSFNVERCAFAAFFIICAGIRAGGLSLLQVEVIR